MLVLLRRDESLPVGAMSSGDAVLRRLHGPQCVQRRDQLRRGEQLLDRLRRRKQLRCNHLRWLGLLCAVRDRGRVRERHRL